ncbi:trans-2,3-dihydro-3-hydroxyanthranilate isomerase [Streptacidiphilus sp. MAP12-33]|uniref:PhzF family phenazine biosynthesis protein n=1 Tax=Streptacidiphilus sp. MAP12-33 TaxID=3156266 RepID=UPI003517E429
MTTPRPHGSGRSAAIPVTIVHACLREGGGGSPTAVVPETGDLALDDAARRRIPALVGTSHAVFLSAGPDGGTAVRFFTAEGELPACGHGTVAAFAYLADRAGTPTYRATLTATHGGHTLRGEASLHEGLVRAEFEVGSVALREPTAQELGLLLPALGLPLVAAARIATLGRPRLLVRLPNRGALDSLAPDLPALEEACRSLDLLGCYAYTALPAAGRRYAARMFAPAIGVPEDIANANSTACLAALQHANGGPGTGLTVDMGDRLGSPATISASPVPAPTASSAAAPPTSTPLIRVGGLARVETPSPLG